MCVCVFVCRHVRTCVCVCLHGNALVRYKINKYSTLVDCQSHRRTYIIYIHKHVSICSYIFGNVHVCGRWLGLEVFSYNVYVCRHMSLGMFTYVCKYGYWLLS